MAEEVNNLVLEHLRAIRADVHEIKTVQREHGHRLTRVEIALAGIRRDQALDSENLARMDLRVDRLSEDVERIKRRLDLVD